MREEKMHDYSIRSSACASSAGEIAQLVGASLREPHFDDDLLAFRVAEVPQPSLERFDPGRRRLPGPREPDPPELHTTLRTNGERRATAPASEVSRKQRRSTIRSPDPPAAAARVGS